MNGIEESIDPLGARDNVVQVESLTRWNFTHLPLAAEDSDVKDDVVASPFPWSNELNKKIILWNGDILNLSVHVIVHCTNEKMNEKSSQTLRLFEKAGPKLEEEIRNSIIVCKTGEAKIALGYNLLCRQVILTVGPRYNVKYVTAAEGALYSSYRNVLQLARESSLRTIGLSCIHSLRRGYPVTEGAHIAIRTVRRFLEKYGSSFDSVVFVCEDDTFEAYQKVLPLYFPRSPVEERENLHRLPRDIGNEMGEPVIPERQIRILDKPTFQHKLSLGGDADDGEAELEKTVDLNHEFGRSINGSVGQHPFAAMQEHPDTLKRQHRHSDVEQRKIEQKKRYERLLKWSRTEDLTDIASLRCLYRTGQDRYGRPVIVFVGKNFNAEKVDLEKALLYMIRLMDPIVGQDYVVVYFHTNVTSENNPPMHFLRQVYMTLDHKYKKNLKSFYIVHPTWWSKFATWFFTTFTASDIKTKVHSLQGVQYLYAKINPDQLDIPPFVLEHDIKVNGQRYCVDFTDESVAGEL